ncbi:MAG: hypothetical protein ISS47_05760 [Candidatus Omnitrophica bacterium]|nr:hypothetical protein [Candidatus Omnitrophota bacterium]
MVNNLEFNICKDISNWDTELLAYKYAHPLQSTAFAHFLEKQGYSPLFLRIIYDGNIIGHCCVSVIRKSISTWSYGPLVKEQHRDKYNDIVCQLKQFLIKKNIKYFDNAKTEIFYNNEFCQRDWNLYSKICETPYIDLEQGWEKIRASFDRSVIKNIRKCEGAGVNVLITNDPYYVPLYIEMLSSHYSRLALKMPPFYPNVENMKIFSGPYSFMEIALASIEQTYLAGLGFVRFGNVVTEIGLGQSDTYLKLKLPVHDLIKVKAIENFLKKGLKLFDLCGIESNPINKKGYNIRRFKLKFTRNIAEYGILRNRRIYYLDFLNFKLIKKTKELLLRKNDR